MTAATKIKGAASKFKPKPPKPQKVDPVILRTERIYAGILTDKEAEAFAASIGRKL